MEQSWRGCSMEEIHRNRSEFELQHVAPVRPGMLHAVLYQFPIRVDRNEPPQPLRAGRRWDSNHVRLPCSVRNQYPVALPNGESTLAPRWEMVQKAFMEPITNSHQFQRAVLSYNTKYVGEWDFCALHQLFEDDLDESETRAFFEDLLPRIVRLALRLPELIQAPIPLLTQYTSNSLSLTQEQISCLLANAFLCTYPRRNNRSRRSEYSSFPDINFNRLFQATGSSVLEKIKCICHYFRRVCPTEHSRSNVPVGVVTFKRRYLTTPQIFDFPNCEDLLGATPLHVTSEGYIEDEGKGLLQVDFANKYVGGGVLGSGCVQEEIRFVICPELIVARLFTESLYHTEALLVVGCERFSNYTGYGNSFRWAGNHVDCTPFDGSRRRMTNVVAIDALSFPYEAYKQFETFYALRDMQKAYAGFMHELSTPAPGVASGNWGCGAFGGDPRLKALIQLMACTAAKRPLVYFTFGDTRLRDDIYAIHKFFIEKGVKLKDLWNAMKTFKPPPHPVSGFYDHLRKVLDNGEQQNPITHNLSGAPPSTSSASVAVVDSTSANAKEKQEQRAISSDSEEFLSGESVTSDEDEIPVVKHANSTTAETNEVRITISDDSATDAALVAAVDEAIAVEPSAAVRAENAIPDVRQQQQQQPQEGQQEEQQLQQEEEEQQPQQQEESPARKTDGRQRSLLEMWDQGYSVPEAPASKRPCQDVGQASGGLSAAAAAPTNPADEAS